jgi:hypothetical protein
VYFSASSLLKVGAILTVVEGLFIMVLVPIYWSLVGLSWRTEPAEHRVVLGQAEVAQLGTADNRTPKEGQPSDITTSSAALTSPMTSTSLSAEGLDAETTGWASIRDSTVPSDFVEFLAAFPQPRFAFAARMRLRQLLRESRIRLPSTPLEEGQPARSN